MVIVLALGIAFLIPLAFLSFIKTRDLFATGKFHFVYLSMIWGLFAYLIAAQLNPFIVDMGWATETQVKTLIGPILEELLKAAVLVYLVHRADFNYIVDGAVYGFAAGMGFAMIENVEYVLGYSEIAIVVALARVFSTNLIHAAGSGVIGVALSLRLAEKSAQGWLWAALGYGLAGAFHAIFNTMVSGGAAVVFAVMFGGVGIGFIYLAIQRGLKRQKAFISEKLGDLNRVTQNEVRALNRIEELNELLRPFALQFGKEKTEMVKLMMSKQAEIAIKTKLLDTTFNQTKKEEMTRIIASLRADMEALRARLGPYCMLFVRQVYLSQDMNLWGAIQDRVAESRTGQKGGGLWERAASRVQSSKSREKEA